MKNKLTLILLFLALIITSCSGDDTDFIDSLWVNSEKIDVESFAGGTVNCYQVQENEFVNENDWQSLCQSIEGFDGIYEEGYIYQISVNKIKIKNPPQDGSSVKYELIEVLSKEIEK